MSSAHSFRTETPWFDQATGRPVADPFGTPTAPTIAATNLTSNLTDAAFAPLWIEALTKYRDQLTRAIRNEAITARFLLQPLTEQGTHPPAAAAVADADTAIRTLTTLTALRDQIDQMLGDSEHQHYR